MTEHEELLMLRKLVEKQQQELAKKNQDILKKDQDILRKEQDILRKDQDILNKEQDILRKKQDILKKEQMIEKLNIQVENMLQALLHARKKLFGASSETTAAIAGQQSLFETTSELAKELLAEQKKDCYYPLYT